MCENIYKVVRFSFFFLKKKTLKSLVILYFLDLPYQEFLFFVFQKGREGEKYCADNDLVTRYYLVVFFLKPLIPVIIISTVLFYAIITIIIIIIHCVCVYI